MSIRKCFFFNEGFPNPNKSLSKQLGVGEDAAFVRRGRSLLVDGFTHILAIGLGAFALYHLSRNVRNQRPVRADNRNADGLFFNF